MKKIYIAGPYRYYQEFLAHNSWEVEQNIRRAEELGMRVAEMGAIPIIPHTMYRYWDGTLTDAFWLAAGMELLDVCDAVCVAMGYENSSGTRAEISHAIIAGKGVFYSEMPEDMEQLRDFINGLLEPSV